MIKSKLDTKLKVKFKLNNNIDSSKDIKYINSTYKYSYNNSKLKGRSSNLFPKINSSEFRNLSFNEQVWIYNLYLNDRDKYYESVGLTQPPSGTEYVDEGIKFISKLYNKGYPEEYDDSSPLYITRDFWTGYNTYYSDRWFIEEAPSPLDFLGIKHKQVIYTHLFTFPLLSVDKNTFYLLRFLQDHKSLKGLKDKQFYIIKLRAALEYFEQDLYEIGDGEFRLIGKDSNYHKTNLWNLSEIKLKGISSIIDLNENYPVLDINDQIDEAIIDMLEDDTYVALLSKPRKGKTRYFIPLIPSELYMHSKFHIRDWGFLVLR